MSPLSPAFSTHRGARGADLIRDQGGKGFGSPHAVAAAQNIAQKNHCLWREPRSGVCPNPLETTSKTAAPQPHRRSLKSNAERIMFA